RHAESRSTSLPEAPRVHYFSRLAAMELNKAVQRFEYNDLKVDLHCVLFRTRPYASQAPVRRRALHFPVHAADIRAAEDARARASGFAACRLGGSAED